MRYRREKQNEKIFKKTKNFVDEHIAYNCDMRLFYGIFSIYCRYDRLAEKIDFQANTGATKFKARIDSLSVAGLAFCASAITIIAIKKITEKK